MIIDSDQIRPQLSRVLQRLMTDVLAKSDGSRPLEFGDAQEHQKMMGVPFPREARACLIPSNKRFIIIIELGSIRSEDEIEIAHELGHLWLHLHNFPRERQYIIPDEQERQDRYNKLFGPLLEIMEHAIFYPWLKTIYKIDLYKVGKQRLVDFLRNELPNRKIESDGDRVSLTLNYLKFKVESDDLYWQERMHKAYTKGEFVKLREKAEGSLPIIQELATKTPDPQDFIGKYCDVLKACNIKREIWPDFAQQTLEN